MYRWYCVDSVKQDRFVENGVKLKYSYEIRNILMDPPSIRHHPLSLYYVTNKVTPSSFYCSCCANNYEIR